MRLEDNATRAGVVARFVAPRLTGGHPVRNFVIVRAQ